MILPLVEALLILYLKIVEYPLKIYLLLFSINLILTLFEICYLLLVSSSLRLVLLFFLCLEVQKIDLELRNFEILYQSMKVVLDVQEKMLF